MEKSKNKEKYGSIPEEDLEKLKLEVDKKRKRYNSPQDILTVFAVFSILALACVAAMFIGKNPDLFMNAASGAAKTTEKYQKAKTLSYAITGVIAAVSLLIIFLFIRSMKKRKKKEVREFEIKELKRLELEVAKRRVANARMDNHLAENMSERDRRRAMRKYSLDDEFEDDDITERRRSYSLDEFDEGENYSRKIRNKKYNIGNMEDFENENFENENLNDKKYGFFAKIKNFFIRLFTRKNKK